MKKIVAVFDFDGTLTRRDSLPLFIFSSLGYLRFIFTILYSLPWLVAYKCHLCANWKAKEAFFSAAFKGICYRDFKQLGSNFSKKYPTLINQNALETMLWHLSSGHEVYVISASMEEWIAPYFSTYGSIKYLTTMPAVENGVLTGSFLGNNCYGKEKVDRLLIAEPDRESYVLYAYGDSKGDCELLSFADYPFYRSFE